MLPFMSFDPVRKNNSFPFYPSMYYKLNRNEIHVDAYTFALVLDNANFILLLFKLFTGYRSTDSIHELASRVPLLIISEIYSLLVHTFPPYSNQTHRCTA